jgi:hypothetical protein
MSRATSSATSSATTAALFGDAAVVEPATPGSYGEPPRGGFRLPDATRLGAVRLQVADLARSTIYGSERQSGDLQPHAPSRCAS